MPDAAAHTPFSTIQFFKLFQAALQNIDTPPLDMQTLLVQQDAYARLAHLEESDDYLNSPEVFATLEYNKKEKDTDLRFIVQFASGCLMLDIEGLVSGVYDLRDPAVFKSEASVVKQLIGTLKMLLNGQIAVGLTLFGGDICASEMIVTDRSARRHIVTATIPSFAGASKRATADDLEHLVLKNHYPFNPVSVAQDSLLYDAITPEMTTEYGRPGDEALAGPLTYRQLKDKVQQEVEVRIGQKPGESNLVYLFRSWEFWVLGLILGIVPVGLRLSGHLPQVFLQHSAFIMVPLTIVAAFLTPYVKEKRLARQHKKAAP